MTRAGLLVFALSLMMARIVLHLALSFTLLFALASLTLSVVKVQNQQCGETFAIEQDFKLYGSLFCPQTKE